MSELANLALLLKRLGVLYGLAKVLKASVNTPANKLATFLVPILAPDWQVNEFSVKDSFQFSDEIRKQHSQLFYD